MRIECEGITNTDAFHNGKRCAVDKTKGLIGKRLDNSPRRLDVNGKRVEDGYLGIAQGAPKFQGLSSPEVRVEQTPGLRND